jgi:hypothetical protein
LFKSGLDRKAGGNGGKRGRILDVTFIFLLLV